MRIRARHIVSAFTAVVLAFILGSASAEPAEADAFTGPCTATLQICAADDPMMDYCTPYPWPLFYGNTFTDSMINLDTQTDMWRYYSAVCDPHTDLGGYLNSSPEWVLTSEHRGIYICTTPLGGWGNTRCDQSSIIINTAVLGTVYAQVRKTLCHEIGHATGLYHGTGYGGCMVSGSSTNSTYAAHHVAHINAFY